MTPKKKLMLVIDADIAHSAGEAIIRFQAIAGIF